MKIFPTLRALARIAKAMERANELKEHELGFKRRKAPKAVEISVASIEERNKNWRAEQDPFEG